MPTVRSMDYRPCAVHGESLHLMSRCVHCHKPKETKQPSWVNTPIGTPSRPQRQIRRGRPASVDLTPSERAAATLIAKGLTQKEVGERLGIYPTAISSVLQRARDRIGAETTMELIRYVRTGTIERAW